VKRKNITKNLITALLTFSFAWLVCGTIVQFHQIYVIGKTIPSLEQHFIKPKNPDKKQKSEIVKLLSKSDQGQVFCLSSSLSHIPGIFSTVSIVLIPSFEVLTIQSSPPTLRAPPSIA
jgi:hypothetical protein